MTTCPCCGSTITQPERVIDDEHELMMLLHARSDRQIYRSRVGTWHYTYSGSDRHRVSDDLVRRMVEARTLRPTYLGSEESFGLERTIDLDKTIQARRKAGKRDIIIYASQ